MLSHYIFMLTGIFVTLLSLLVKVHCEESSFFAALTQLEDVFKSEGQIIDIFNNSLDEIYYTIKEIERKIKEMKEFRSTIVDSTKYLQNPINSYLYIKHLVESFDFLDIHLAPIVELYDALDDSMGQNSKLPSYTDIDGAANAILRVQQTYKLKTQDLINGRIYNTQASPLKAKDCLHIIETAFSDKTIHDQSESWLNHAYNLCFNTTEPQDDCNDKVRVRILEYKAWTEFLAGKNEEGLKHTLKLLEINGEHVRAKNNQKYFEDQINNDPSLSRSGKYMLDPHGEPQSTNLYSFACRGFGKIRSEIQSKLKCSYVHYNNPYLMLGPIKEEEAYLDPRIVIFRDIMFENEIDDIKNISKPLLTRSAVQGDKKPDKVRVSKLTWLEINNGQTTATLTKRFSAYSDLHLKSGEGLQVVNYGLGGHYSTHFDAINDDSLKDVFGSFGNRLATLLVYMNDVEIGGDTVFPRLGVSVKPEKGTAVFWYNLHNNGSLDKRTDHAACPVAVGTKWAINVWYHTAYNEFTKPCIS